MASCQDKVRKSKEQYEVAVSAITNYNSRYQEVCRIYLFILVILLIYGLYTIWNIKWFVTKLEAKLSSFCKSLTISRSILFYLKTTWIEVFYLLLILIYRIWLMFLKDVKEKKHRDYKHSKTPSSKSTSVSISAVIQCMWTDFSSGSHKIKGICEDIRLKGRRWSIWKPY